MSLSAMPDAMRSRVSLSLVARLKPGASIEQARAEMRVLDRARIEALAKSDPQWLHVAIDVTPARTGLDTPLHQQFGGPLLLLMTMVGGAAAAGLRQHRQHAARARRGAAARDGGARVAWRRTFPHHAAGVDRIAAPGLDRRRARRRRRAIRRDDADADHDLGHAIAGPAPSLDIALDARVLSFTIGAPCWRRSSSGSRPRSRRSCPRRRPRCGRAAARSRDRDGCSATDWWSRRWRSRWRSSAWRSCTSAHLRHLRDRSLGFDRDGVLLMSVNNARAQNRQQLAALYRDLVPRAAGDSRRARGCGERHDADGARGGQPLPAGRRIRRARGRTGAGSR